MVFQGALNIALVVHAAKTGRFSPQVADARG
jgi:hypothetical protein